MLLNQCLFMMFYQYHQKGNQLQKNEELSPFRAHLQMYQQEERVKYNYLMRENSSSNQLYRNDSLQSGASSPQNYRNKVFNFFSKQSGMKQSRSYDKIKQNEQSLNQDIIQKIQDKFNNQLVKCSNTAEQSEQQSLNISKLQNLNSVGRSTYFHDFQGSVKKANTQENPTNWKSQEKFYKQQNQLTEEDDFFNIKIRKSFRAAISHYCQNLENELSKYSSDDHQWQEKTKSREYCFDLAIKIIHLLNTEITPFSSTFNLLGKYCKSIQYCNQNNMLKLSEYIKNQLEYEDKVKNITAEKQYELYLQMKKKEKLSQISENSKKQQSFFEIAINLSQFIAQKCKDMLIYETKKRDKIFDNFKNLDASSQQANTQQKDQLSGRSGNIIIGKNNQISQGDKHRYSFLFSFDKKLEQKNQTGNQTVRASILNNNHGKENNNQQKDHFDTYLQEYKFSKNSFNDQDDQSQNDVDEDDENEEEQNETFQNLDNSNFEKNLNKSNPKLNKKIKQSKKEKQNNQIAEKFSQQKDEFVINQILQERFDDFNKEEERKEREREEQELEEKLKNAQDMGMITDIIQTESENVHRALTDNIWQLIEVIKQRFYHDKQINENDNLDDLTTYVKEVFVTKIEELQEKQINQIKQKFTFQIEILQKKCKQLRVQFLQSQKIQQYLFQSKTELYEYLKNIRNQIEDLRDKTVQIQSERDALILQLKDIQLGIKPNLNLYFKQNIILES
ncbi:hypothetical protein ABPG72_001340 [Tetrahymena utriculariae]